ncbi:hypothetical protein [Spiroplasma endosymbiont of Agriotes lineatus]|uniref:hypothetical protein n=1 Tax=Spiroplasma endosymbiont of Agriotes lineatus TaxID=3077930 RepID=UPI0030CFB602
MFMKIFTVLIIGFNNIFTILKNINKSKAITQLNRNKRQINETYEFTLSKAKINWMWDGFRQNFSIALSEFDKNESGLNKLPIDFKNTLAIKNSYIYLDEKGISTLKTDNLGRNGDLKVTNIKGKIIKTRNFYNWLEFNFQHNVKRD